MVYDSQSTIWQVQRSAMNPCSAGGSFCVDTETIGVLNPILIVLLVPLFDQLLIPALARAGTSRDGSRNWIFPTPLRRMGAGMQIAALSFLGTAVLQGAIDRAPPKSVSIWWQVPQYVVISVSEILVSITGLEFAFSQAPPDMKSTILAFFFLTMTLGDLATAVLYDACRARLSLAVTLCVFAALLAAAGLVFIAIAVAYKPRPLPPTAAAGAGDDAHPPRPPALAKERALGGSTQEEALAPATNPPASSS